MKNSYSIELNGKIYGNASSIEDAKRFAKNLGNKAIIFHKGIVVYPM